MKQQTIPKDSLPQDVQQNCTEFSSSLSTIEQLLKPLANGEFNNKELAPIERAKLNLCCAYTVNTLLYMYLKTQGIDPNEHPMRDELKRVQEYIEKLRQHTAKFDALISNDNNDDNIHNNKNNTRTNSHTKFNKNQSTENNNNNNSSTLSAEVQEARPAVITVDKQAAERFLQDATNTTHSTDESSSTSAAAPKSNDKKKQQKQKRQTTSTEEKSGESPKKRRRKNK